MRDSGAVLSSASALDTAGAGFEPSRLLAPEQAAIAFLAAVHVAPPGVEHVPLERAAGRVLAEPAVAREDHPSHARSTMDGYAIAAGAHGRLTIAGEVRMGRAPDASLAAGEAIRIPTGGALPAGADAVVPQEDVTLDGDAIVVARAPAAGDCTTQRADDVREGETVLAAGRRIGAPELGVLATLGIAHVPVFRRPRIGIISTGDELVDPHAALELGQVRDSNRYAIGGALAAMGAEPVQLPRAKDTAKALAAALEQGLAECDALVLTGGSSVGVRDLVPRAVAALGAPGPIVHGIRVKPGKPTMLGAVGSTPVIGLPGNPTSSLMVLEAVARPIVAALTGDTGGAPPALTAVADEAFEGRDGWTWYVPARLRLVGATLHATPLVLRSAHTSLLARAAGYVAVGESPARVEAGALVAVRRFSCGGAPIEVA